MLDKSGLGRGSFLREKEAQKKLESKLSEETSVSEFRKKKQAILNVRKQEADLKRSQLACEQLDVEAGITTPKLSWFWRPSDGESEGYEKETVDEEEEEELIDVKLLYGS